MVLVVPDLAWKAAVTALLSEQTTVAPVALELEDGLPEQVVDRLRRAHDEQEPIAYLASNELSALDAIEAGADESLALRRDEPTQVLVLIDRAQRRAHKRIALERAQALAARSEKLEALEAVVAGVAHEINNPLSAMGLSVELLRGSLGPLLEAAAVLGERAHAQLGLSPHELAGLQRTLQLEGIRDGSRVLSDLLDLVESCAAIVRDLRTYARASDEDQPEVVDLPELIEQALRIVGRDLRAVALIERDYDELLPQVVVPRARVVQVLTNLLVNAMHAMQDVSRPVHRLRLSVRADAEAVAISISDTGTGISSEALDRIFDPFFTTKGDGRGSGLGLYISRSIMLRIGGDLMVESIHGTGATFITFIPLPTDEALRCALLRARTTSSRAPVGRSKVLIVEDDQRLLRLYPRLLQDQFDVITAASGQEAIELLASGTQLDAVLSDLSMPDVNGQALYEWVCQHRPELTSRILFVTGADDQKSQHFLASVHNLSLPKPVASEKLIATLQRVLERG